MIVVYGIRNCDKCRAALKWFASEGIEHSFHDLRQDGLDQTLLTIWLTRIDADALLNKRSKTWRAIPAERRDEPGKAAVIKLVLDYPTVIKRPLVDNGAQLQVGYDEDAWRQLLA